MHSRYPGVGTQGVGARGGGGKRDGGSWARSTACAHVCWNVVCFGFDSCATVGGRSAPRGRYPGVGTQGSVPRGVGARGGGGKRDGGSWARSIACAHVCWNVVCFGFGSCATVGGRSVPRGRRPGRFGGKSKICYMSIGLHDAYLFHKVLLVIV